MHKWKTLAQSKYWKVVVNTGLASNNKLGRTIVEISSLNTHRLYITLRKSLLEQIKQNSDLNFHPYLIPCQKKINKTLIMIILFRSAFSWFFYWFFTCNESNCNQI